jgi:hypothetical protein
MAHRPPLRHPNPFRPDKDELEGLRSGVTTSPRWKSVLKIVLLLLLVAIIVGLHVAGVVGAGLHAGG